MEDWTTSIRVYWVISEGEVLTRLFIQNILFDVMSNIEEQKNVLDNGVKEILLILLDCIINSLSEV